jgi:Ca2+-binding RTX toxin-like protein
MSFSDAELLSVSGEDWNSYMASNSETALGYTFYSPLVNPFPNYYFTDNPTNSAWAGAFTSFATPGTAGANNQSVQSLQTTYIRHVLSDTTGVDYRVSFSDVSNLHFAEQNYPSAVGEIFIANTDITASTALGATARPTSANGLSTFAGDVFLDNDGSGAGSHTDIMQNKLHVGEEGATAILHELAHAIGLRHFSDTSYSGSDNNLKYTIMVENLAPDGGQTNLDMDSSVYPTGLQLYDIVAVQGLYGMNWGGARGASGAHEDTVYSKETAFATDNAHDAFIYTIWDGAGTDVIDASDYTTPAEIDLRQGHFSSIGVKGDPADTPVPFDTAASGSTHEYDAGNVAIAYHAIIENAIGTGANDTLIGNEWNNILYGGAGNDTIVGDGVSYDGDAGYHDPNTIADATSTVYRWGPDAIAPASDNSGNDILIGGAGNDTLYGGLGDDVLHGGYKEADITSAVSGWDSAGEFTGSNNALGAAISDIAYNLDGYDTADYSQLPEGTGGSHAGIDVVSSTDYTEVTKGYAGEYGTDTLFSIEAIVGTPWNDVFEGDNGSNNVIIGSGGVDTIESGSYPYAIDYSKLDGPIDVSASSGTLTVDKGVSGVLGEDTLSDFTHVTIVGTTGADVFSGALGVDTLAVYSGNGGNDTFNFDMSADRGAAWLYVPADDGLVSLNVANAIGLYVQGEAAENVFELSFGTLDGSGEFVSELELLIDDRESVAAGANIDLLSLTSGSPIDMAGVYAFLADAHPSPEAASDLRTDVYNYEFTAGTGGAGAGGNVLPVWDESGNVTTMQVNPLVGGSPISYGIAGVDYNPFVITSFSESYVGGTYTSSATWQTYEQSFTFLSGITANDIRLTASGTQGDASLTIHIDSLGYSVTISDFETGHEISGLQVYNGTMHEEIQDASNATLSASGTNTFAGSYTTFTGLSVDTNGSVDVTYHLQDLYFADDSNISLSAPLTFVGSGSNDSLTGLDSRADIIYGMDGNDTIYSYGGNDELIGGAGNDNLYGGLGDDTYVFASGWGTDTVHESTGSGTDTISFTGIDPADIRMYTDTSGYLHLVDTVTSDSITVYAGITGSNTDESTIGSYVEQVTFDDTNNTVWDLTGALTITGSSSVDSLYGTAYNDVIYGMAGSDTIYGNAGNDDIIGGAGNDNLYGGPGDDTYVFASGWGTDSVHESTGSGTDTISFTGIDPADIRMYTDTAGYLHLVDTVTSDAITVYAGITGSNTDESTVGSYVESVTFDDTNHTTWDLTGALTITGSSSADSLYGTAYNDVIYGMAGSDTIYGNAGNDDIIGGAGNDNLYGGPGDDTYVFASGWGTDSVHESTGSGTDTISFTGIDPADIRMYTDTAGYLHLVDTVTSDAITVYAGITGSNTDESTVGSYVESVTFDDTNHTTWDLTGALTITGSSTTDSLYGTAYNDVIYGMAGSDTIYGNAGNDDIIGGAGNDYLYGGPGDDTYTFASGWGSDTVSESLSSGNDTISFTGIDPADVRMYTDTNGYLHLVDTVTGDSMTVIAGQTGNNLHESTIGSYVEQVTFDDTNNTVWDLTGALTITGSSTTDSLYGTAYNDVIYGMAGSDTIYGNAGNDNIIGGAGNDYLYGGPGDDTYTFASGWGSDTVSESLSSGNDTIAFTGIDPADVRMYTDTNGYLHLVDTVTGDAITVNAGQTGSNTHESTVGSYVEQVTFDDTNNTVWDLTGGLTITGTSGSENLYGTAYDDTINGMGGADNLYGNAGNDTLNGGSSAEYLYGGPGNDVLVGNGGADYVNGGAGADIFVFKAASALGASVTIADFNTGDGDRIDISDVLSGHYNPLQDAIDDFVTMTTSGSNTLLKVDLDGTGGTYSPTQIATITGVTGLNVDDLVSSGHLLVAA